MPFITETRSDVALKAQLPTFLANATANADDLGLTAPEIEALGELFDTFTLDMDSVDAAKLASKAAVSAKNESASVVREQIAQYAKTWRANPAIKDSVLADMNVPPHQTQGSQTPAVPPTNLSFSFSGTGLIDLTWKRGGNKSGTVYNIQTREGTTGAWSVAFTTTKTKATISGNPGTPLYIRVVAIRGASVSAPSNGIDIWADGGSGEVIQLAA